MKPTRFKKADIFLFLGIILIGAILAAVILLLGQKGASVQVRVAGEVIAVYSLDSDAEIELNGVNGGTNLLVISDGAAQVTEASCPDGLCIGMGKISRAGQSIVCLPNQVVIEVISDSSTDKSEVDLVAG